MANHIPALLSLKNIFTLIEKRAQNLFEFITLKKTESPELSDHPGMIELLEKLPSFMRAVSPEAIKGVQEVSSESEHLSTHKPCSISTIMLQAISQVDNGDTIIREIIRHMTDPSEPTQAPYIISQFLLVHELKPKFKIIISELEEINNAVGSMLEKLSDHDKQQLCTQIIKLYQQVSMIISLPRSLTNRRTPNLQPFSFVSAEELIKPENMKPIYCELYASIEKLNRECALVKQEPWLIKLYSISLIPHHNRTKLREISQEIIREMQTYWDKNTSDNKSKIYKELSRSKTAFAKTQQKLAQSIPPEQPDASHPFLGGDSPIIVPDTKYIDFNTYKQLQLLTTYKEDIVKAVSEEAQKLIIQIIDTLAKEKEACIEYYAKVTNKNKIIHEETMPAHHSAQERKQRELDKHYAKALENQKEYFDQKVAEIDEEIERQVNLHKEKYETGEQAAHDRAEWSKIREAQFFEDFKKKTKSEHNDQYLLIQHEHEKKIKQINIRRQDSLASLASETTKMLDSFQSTEINTDSLKSRDISVFDTLLETVPLLQEHAIRKLKESNFEFFIGDAFAQLKETLAPHTCSSSKAIIDLESSENYSETWNILNLLTSTRTISTDNEDKIRSILIDDCEAASPQNYLKNVVKLIIKKHKTTSRQYIALNKLLPITHTEELLISKIESIVRDLDPYSLNICAHACQIMLGSCRDEMKSDLRQLVRLSTKLISTPKSPEISASANEVSDTILEIHDSKKTEKNICIQLANALKLYTSSENPVTALHRFPFVSRLLIQAESTEAHLADLNEQKYVPMQEVFAKLTNLFPRSHPFKLPSHSDLGYGAYKENIETYYSDMKYFFNLMAVGQPQSTREQIKHYAGRISIKPYGNFSRGTTKLGEMFKGNQEKPKGQKGDFVIQEHHLSQHILAPNLTDLTNQYDEIQRLMPSPQTVKKINQIHPTIGWQLYAIMQNLEIQFKFLLEITDRNNGTSITSLPTEVWQFMVQIEQLQIKYQALLEEIDKQEKLPGYNLDLSLIKLLESLHTRISKATLPLISYEKPATSQADFLWNMLYNNLHATLLPKKDRMFTNLKSVYLKTMVDTNSEMARITQTSSLLVANIGNISDASSKIETFSSDIEHEKTLLTSFLTSVNRFIGVMMEASSSHETKLNAFYSINAVKLLSLLQNKRCSTQFKAFMDDEIIKCEHDDSNWFFTLCLNEQFLLACRHMHTKVSAFCQSFTQPFANIDKNVQIFLQFDEKRNLIVHLSENLKRLVGHDDSSLKIDIGLWHVNGSLSTQLEQIASAETGSKISLEASASDTIFNEHEEIRKEVVEHITEIVKAIPEKMVVHLPTELARDVINTILRAMDKHPKKEMILCLDNPNPTLLSMMTDICIEKPDHYKLRFRDSVFEPFFDNDQFQEVLEQETCAEDRSLSQLKMANQFYSTIDIMNFLISERAEKAYDRTKGNIREIGIKVPKEREWIAHILHENFVRSPKDSSEKIIRFTRSLEQAIGTANYAWQPSSIFSSNVMFLPQSNHTIHLVPTEIIQESRNTSAPPKKHYTNQGKLSTRATEELGEYPLEAFKVGPKWKKNPFTRDHISDLHAELLEQAENQFQLFYHEQSTGTAADNFVGNNIDFEWHLVNMRECLATEQENPSNDIVIRKLNELANLCRKVSKTSHYDHTLMISKIRYLSTEITRETSRKCTSFFMWPFLEHIGEDPQISTFKALQEETDLLSQNKNASQQLLYAKHLLCGWGCKANIIESLKILTNTIQLSQDDSVILEAKSLIYHILFFKKIIIHHTEAGIKKLTVNSSYYHTNTTAHLQADSAKLDDLAIELDELNYLNYHESDLEIMFEGGSDSAGLLIAQIYLSGTFKNFNNETIRNTPENLGKAVQILINILERDPGNASANLLYGIALRSGLGTHILPKKSKQHLDTTTTMTELPSNIDSMIHEDLLTWKLGRLSHSTTIHLKLTEEIVQDIAENQKHLSLGVTQDISLERIYEPESFNNVLQVGVLLNISDTSSIFKTIPPEKIDKLREQYEKIMKDGWDILTRDGDRFLLLLKFPLFEECLTKTIYDTGGPKK